MICGAILTHLCIIFCKQTNKSSSQASHLHVSIDEIRNYISGFKLRTLYCFFSNNIDFATRRLHDHEWLFTKWVMRYDLVIISIFWTVTRAD